MGFPFGQRLDLNSPEGQAAYTALRENPAGSYYNPRRGGHVAKGGDVYVYAEKGGKPGVMLPGKPESWVSSEKSIGYNAAAQKRHKALQAAAGNTAAPAKPADSSIVSRGQNLPPSAAVPGTGPEDNKVGSDADPNTPGLQGPGAPSARINANGLKAYGRDLSSLNAFTKDFTGGYEITDLKTAFQSEDLPSAYQNGSNSISTEDTKYKLPQGIAPSTLNEGLAGAELEMPSNTTYQIGEASVPGTLGRSGDAQEGASDKPDIADNVRTIRMQRKNARDDGSFRGFQKDNNNALAQMTKAEEPDAGKIAQEQRRNKIRSTFLDMDTPIIKASVAANAVAGYGKDSDGNAQFNYGGKLVQAKEGMQQQAKNAAMMGKDPSQFLAIKLDEVKKDQEKNM